MNLKDKVYLVTGATSGIGKETATALSAMGGNVVFTARSAKKGEETLKEIVSRTGNNQTSFLVVDFLLSLPCASLFAILPAT